MTMVKLAALLAPIYQTAAPICDRGRIKLNFDLSDPSLSVDANEKTLARQLKSLLKAAILRTPKDGSVTIGAHRRANTVEIFIRDTGSALSKSERAELAPDGTLSVHARHGYGNTITLHFPES